MPRQPFPGVITAIEPQAKVRRHLGQRVNVFISDRFSFALDASLAVRHGLRPEFFVTKELLEELLREDGDARAYARALHFMGYRVRSTAEVRARLERDEWPPEVIDRVLQRLAHEGLLNDTDFAATWVEHRSLSRPRGTYALTQELRQKGVARDDIDAALPDSEQELENAVAALRPKLRLWQNLDERARQEKALGFLQRRGFNYSTARAALRRLEEAEETESF
ncbi:MAG TPA: RecX family transcriptional regulator [Abditibacteriaceae bacterium]|nr:RecX family transcriptional regulator [Abditibacteriaceae bacterium]